MPLDVRVLGAVDVLVDGVSLPLGGRKQRSVLAMLVLADRRPVSVERLVDGVWGERAGDRASATLQVYVSTLRRILADAGAPGLLVTRRPGYALELPEGATDVDRVRERLAEAAAARTAVDPTRVARAIRTALAEWRGPTLADLATEPFALHEVVKYDELRASLLEDRVEAELACGRHADLVGELEGAIAATPLRERLWAALMLALYRCGRQADALRAFARARELLLEELGLDPGPGLRELEARILGQDPALELPGRTRPRVTLPVAATELVGRRVELDCAVNAIVRGVRLLTLTGPGGVGKTRLSIAVAGQVAVVSPDQLDVRFVAVDTATNAVQLVSAIASSLELSLPGDADPLRAVADAVADRPTLLVLDNCEQVVDVGPIVSRLLTDAPGLQILATSRVPLRLRDEEELRVPPLGLPEGPLVRSRPSDVLSSSDAVALFVHRAVTAREGFVLDESNLAHVVEVCVRLDGLPLAIELAAARLRMMPPAALARRLDSALSVLTGGGADRPPRHRTLRATLDWSYELLTPPQGQLLDRLAAFRGGFTLDAAEAVCGMEALDDLAALVDASLVRTVHGQNAVRFRLPQTVLAYAIERLDATGDAVATRTRHLSHVMAMVGRAVDGLEGPEAHDRISELTAEMPNIRAALGWSCEHAPGQAAILIADLRLYWLVSGRLSEGRQWVAQVVDLGGNDETVVARVHLTAGVLAYFQDDRDLAEKHLGEAVTVARRVGDVELEATASTYTGALLIGAGRLDEARGLAVTALELADRGGYYEPRVLALSLAAVVAAVEGDVVEERALYDRRLVAVRARGDVRRIAETLNNLAEIALLDDSPSQVDQASRLAGEALDIARRVSRLVSRDALFTLGRIALHQGSLAASHDCLREALDLSVDLGQGFETAQCVAALAGVAVDDGDVERAARLFGAARRMRDQAGVSHAELEPDLESRRVALVARLGAPAYDVLASGGAGLGREAVLRLATSTPQENPAPIR